MIIREVLHLRRAHDDALWKLDIGLGIGLVLSITVLVYAGMTLRYTWGI